MAGMIFSVVAKSFAMKFLQNLAGGLAGAVVLSVLHETVRQFDKEAPRFDLVGEEALNKTIGLVGGEPLEGRELYAAALTGDIVGNAVYYSTIGAGKGHHLMRRGAVLGLAAGIGALKLTKALGSDTDPLVRSQKTELLTVCYYLAGGLVTASVIKAFRNKKQ